MKNRYLKFLIISVLLAFVTYNSTDLPYNSVRFLINGNFYNHDLGELQFSLYNFLLSIAFNLFIISLLLREIEKPFKMSTYCKTRNEKNSYKKKLLTNMLSSTVKITVARSILHIVFIVYGLYLDVFVLQDFSASFITFVLFAFTYTCMRLQQISEKSSTYILVSSIIIIRLLDFRFDFIGLFSEQGTYLGGDFILSLLVGTFFTLVFTSYIYIQKLKEEV